MKTILKPPFIALLLILSGCSNIAENESLKVNKEVLFSLVLPKKSGVLFTNTIEETVQFNFINYPYIFNGGGVAAGDINNDGLVDLYFSSNQNSNALYLNKGDLQFEDITIHANVIDLEGWTTGISMIDINEDGLLDIYVCKSGSLTDSKLRQNKLFINQGDNTFIEEAKKYNINDGGFSTQAYFLDFDKDGDMDMYLVNHRPDFENNAVTRSKSEVMMDTRFSDQLYQNNDESFTNVTESAGLVNFTWGLSASIGDFNEDGWPDIYVSNDFLEADNLYINNRDGTFSDSLQQFFGHIPMNSMGSDIADFNNDGLYDLMVVEMSPNDHIRSKSNMPTMSSENFNKIVESGNYYQYMSNSLQLGVTKKKFSEIAQMSGVAKTDWSWAPLFADFDNDGLKDIFITNGIYLDLSNNDFRNSFKEKIKKSEPLSLNDVISMVPSTKISNYIYSNNDNLNFQDSTQSWGLGTPTFSNGAAYADLDNDGDLELIINNLENKATIYRNNAKNNFIKIKLNGFSKNKFGLGAETKIYFDSKTLSQKHYGSRGFQSSVSNYITIGLANAIIVDSIEVIWPSGKISTMRNVKTNQLFIVNEDSAIDNWVKNEKKVMRLQKIDPSKFGITFKHKENIHNDFKEQILLPHKLSQNGPFISKGDINNDGLDDFYIGGAAGQTGELYVQRQHGEFIKITNPFSNDKAFEDQKSIFLDYDSDGDLDLYIVSGSSEFEEGSPLLQDRLYENKNSLKFVRTNGVLPNLRLNGQTVAKADYDKDGDVDVFIGGRQLTNKYPFSPKSYLLINNDGKYSIDTAQNSNSMFKLGMVTDAIFTDFDNDKDEDLIVVGEWAPIQILENKGGRLVLKELPEFNNTNGMWYCIESNDIDNDGDQDYFVGNLGLNAKYHVNSDSEYHIFCDDFDNSGTYDIILSKKYQGNLVPVRGRECSSQQLPEILSKYPDFNSFAKADLIGIIGEKNLKNAKHIEMNMLESVYIENLGNSKFKIQNLPIPVQKSPIMGFGFTDTDNDHTDEILIVGNFYPSEVETIRYDAGVGSILKYHNGKFSVMDISESGFYSFLDMRDINILSNNYDGTTKIIVSNNNDKLEMFSLKEKLIEKHSVIRDEY